MDASARKTIIAKLISSFGAVRDVTPDESQPLHTLFNELDFPEPWAPSPNKAIAVWKNWPNEKPEFYVNLNLVGENNNPPRNGNESYVLGETWRGFSFTFPWAGDNPVLAIQYWMTRFDRERQ